jgi:DNA-binding MarR family transcriptional regulator
LVGVTSSAPELSLLGVDVVVAAARLTRLASRDVTVMPPAAMRLLGRLDELGPTRISDLARADRCSQPTMSNLVQRQQDSGWVRREPDPADSRAGLISLTAAGREQLDRARREAGVAIAARLARLPAEDLATLQAAVTVMRSILSTDPTEASPR